MTSAHWSRVCCCLVVLIAVAAGQTTPIPMGAYEPGYPYTPTDIVHQSNLTLQSPYVCRWDMHINGTNTYAAVLELPPCTWITAHFHPNANEFNFLMQGQLDWWLALPDLPARTINGTTRPGQVAMMPQGLTHTLANLGCTRTVMHHSFDKAYPIFSFSARTLLYATPRLWQDDTFQGRITGLRESDKVHSTDAACIKRCNIDPAKVYVNKCGPSTPLLTVPPSGGN